MATNAQRRALVGALTSILGEKPLTPIEPNEAWSDAAVPERARYWTHTVEGPDDMPAHVKAALFGPSLMLPVSDGRLALGTWQGIYLCEHRDRGGARSVVATVWGEER